MKRAMKGKLGIIPAALALKDEILDPQMSFDDLNGPLAAETRAARRKSSCLGGLARFVLVRPFRADQVVGG